MVPVFDRRKLRPLILALASKHEHGVGHVGEHTQ